MPGPSNLYGVANAPMILFASPSFAGNVSCTANVMTGVFTSGSIVAPSQGYFAVAVWASLRILNGATPPTGLAFAIAIGAGSYNTAQQIGGQGLTPSGNNYVSMYALSVPSNTAWTGAGSTITLGVTAQTTATTVMGDSHCMIMLYRIPDQ